MVNYCIDDFVSQISRKICDLYHKCCSGNEDSVRTFLASHALPPPPLTPQLHCPPAPPLLSQPLPPTVCDMEEGGEENKMEEEEAATGKVPVEEMVMEGEEGEEEVGWEVVRKPRRRSRH